MSELYRDLRKKGVPSYALPRLVRVTEKQVNTPQYGYSLVSNSFLSNRVATSVTFKQAKGDLVKKGWDPSVDWQGDHLYWLNDTTYEKLDGEIWTSIERGEAKL